MLMKNPNSERGVFKQPRGENGGKNKNHNKRQRGTAAGKNNIKELPLSWIAAAIHDSGISQYFGNYFAF